MKRNIIVTGGAGFIGSHVVRLLVNKYPQYHIINVDKLTYAGNLANLKDVENAPNYTFFKGDICDYDAMYSLMVKYNVDGIIHLAAESHVDRSIKDPFTFARTNVMGTLSLLQAAKVYWESLPEKYEGKRFYHISTDEVYGALELSHPEGIEPPFTTTASSSEHHPAYGMVVCEDGNKDKILPGEEYVTLPGGILFSTTSPGDTLTNASWVNDENSKVVFRKDGSVATEINADNKFYLAPGNRGTGKLSGKQAYYEIVINEFTGKATVKLQGVY